MTIKEIFETMDYGPAPESAAEALAWIASHGRPLRLLRRRRLHRARRDLRHAATPPRARRWPQVTQATQADVDRAVAAAAPGAARLGRARRATARARVLYALARLLQKQSRLFAVLETLDNGKPIRESRDIDVPLAAAALLPPRRAMPS